jgi:two-component system OmpR family sensor kinase
MALLRWPRSLIARILLVEAGAIVVAALLLPALMVWLLHAQVDRYQVETLTEQAREIGRGVTLADGAANVKLNTDLAQTYATPYDGRSYVVIDRAGRPLARSAFADLVPWQRARSHDGFFRFGPIAGVVQNVTQAAGDLRVIVTQDETGRGAIIDDVARAFLTRYAPILLLILLLLPLINSFLIRRLVTEVRAVSARAAAIGPETLNVRLPESGLPQEIAPLVHATNALIVRLQQSFRQQSEFVANVAHELRTPLATLRFEIEAIEEEAVREPLGRTVDRLGHVVAQLQALAALELPSRSSTRFDIVEMARERVADMAPAIFAAGDRVALVAPEAPVMVRANRTLIELALSNLIANASRHTPAGTAIEVRVGAQAVIEVIDDGPGIAGGDASRARQRYWRADTRRSDSAGLGLSIVARIMEVHEGELVVDSAPGGGARFALMLPMAALRPEG